MFMLINVKRLKTLKLDVLHFTRRQIGSLVHIRSGDMFVNHTAASFSGAFQNCVCVTLVSHDWSMYVLPPAACQV